MNTIWAVPRNERPDPIKGRALSLLILATVGVAVLATTALSALGTSGAGSLGLLVRVGLVAAAVAINTAVCLFVFRLAPARRLSYRSILPGALAAALSW